MKVDTLLAKYGMTKFGHALFAPSSSAGWLNCPGYLLANAVVGDTAGADAAYGTVAHSIAERWRARGFRPDDMLGKVQVVVGHDILVDRAMLDYVQQFIEWCDEVPGDAFVEQRVDLSAFMPIPGQRGTADHIVCGDRVLTVTDLKMGTGVKVHVERNPQAMLYALGAFEEWDWFYGFQRIVIRICQPRLDYFGVWECSRQELLDFGEYVRERAALAWREDAPRVPGEKQCRFCRVNTTCPALSMHLDSLADDSFEAIEDAAYEYDEMRAHESVATIEDAPKPGNPLQLSTEFLAYRLRFRKLYEKWFATIADELLRRGHAGETIPGWKVVTGRRSYDWTDDADCAKTLLDMGLDEGDVFKSEVTTIANARKLLRAKGHHKKEIEGLLADMIVVKPGKPTLTTATDERQDSQEAVDDALETEDDI